MSEASEASKIEPLMAALDWAYDKAVNGIPNLDRAEDLAESYLKSAQSADAAIDSLISWQIGKASIAGFLSGLGGVITLPIAVPANLLSVLWIQIRMIAAIAHIRGFDIRSDQVKTLVLGCLAGTSVADVMKDVGINVGSKLTQQAISKISGSTLTRVNQAIGFRLLTKAGTSGVVNLSKIIPFIGGVIGGAIDGSVTSAIGAAAKSTFRPQDRVPESSS
jgi:uncharacterized protein (DUF697 family)